MLKQKIFLVGGGGRESSPWTITAHNLVFFLWFKGDERVLLPRDGTSVHGIIFLVVSISAVETGAGGILSCLLTPPVLCLNLFTFLSSNSEVVHLVVINEVK